METVQVVLKTDEIRLLLQSLDHCLATCVKKAEGGQGAPCSDCDQARALRHRLAKSLSKGTEH